MVRCRRTQYFPYQNHTNPYHTRNGVWCSLHRKALKCCNSMNSCRRGPGLLCSGHFLPRLLPRGTFGWIPWHAMWIKLEVCVGSVGVPVTWANRRPVIPAPVERDPLSWYPHAAGGGRWKAILPLHGQSKQTGGANGRLRLVWLWSFCDRIVASGKSICFWSSSALRCAKLKSEDSPGTHR